MFRVALAICQVIETKYKDKLREYDKRDVPNPHYDPNFDA